MCLIPLATRNDSNSALTKHGLLSVTTVSGIPNCAKVVLRCSITTLEVASRGSGKCLNPLRVRINEY